MNQTFADKQAAREAEATRRAAEKQAAREQAAVVAPPALVVAPSDKQAPAETTLALAIARDARSMQVVDAAGFKETTAKQSYFARLGGTELVSVGDIAGNTVVIGRGMNGTRAIAHEVGASVVFGPPTFFGAVPRPPEDGDKVVGQVASDYPHALPRDLHKAHGEHLRVNTSEQCDAALADGWQLVPPADAPYPVTLYAADGKASEVHTVGEAIAARAAGYVLSEKPPPAAK